MTTLKNLLHEAEEVREQYRKTTSDSDRTRLKARYDEIDVAIQNLKTEPTTPAQTKSKRSTRVSLGKRDSVEGIAAELLSLCETLTTDGALSDSEIHNLRDWLTRNDSEELPAVAFLRDVISIALDDGVITSEERKQVYKAIETVLPPDIRKYASQKRKIAEALDKEKAKAARKEAAQVEREKAQRERRLNAPLVYADFMVAGVSYEGRGRIVKKYVKAGNPVCLVRDPKNKFSSNAVEVQTAKGLQIGYVPEEWAEEIGPLLDSNHLYRASVKKLLTGGRVYIPIVVAEIYDPGSTVEGISKSRGTPQGSKGSGCFGVMLCVLSLFLYLLVFE